MKARPGWFGSFAVVMAFLLGGCAAGGDQPRPTNTGDASSPSGVANEIARSSEQIDIGGRSLHLECWGEPVAGEPTVLLVTGQGPTTSSWEPFASGFAAEAHHVCSYDRAGVGGSDPAPEATRTTQDQVADLVALLDATDLEEPVVLAAHSLGSLPAIGFAARAPERVSGVVLIDPWSPRVSPMLRAALPPEQPGESPAMVEERRFLNDFLVDPAQNPEHLLLIACDEEVGRLLDESGPLFGDLPVVVLRSPALPSPPPGVPDTYHAATVSALAEGLSELAIESTAGILIEVEDAGHNIHDDQPGVVMDAIRDVMTG